MPSTIRVLLADDSPTMRASLAAFCAAAPDLSVVGQAADGLEAVRLARTLRPDVITMDVRMPKVDGLAAIRAIMEQAPTRIIVVCSPLGAIDDDLPYRAIQAGALELLAKPAVGRGTPAAFGEKLVQAIRLVAAVPLAGARPAVPRARRSVPIEAFGFAASTGGPPALATILAGLDPSFGAPVFIAQHMAPGFARALASYLASVSSLPVHTVTAPTVGRAGHVYLPADEHDLEVDGEGVLRTRRSIGGHCPSGNRLLHSLASAFGERAGGVVLSGMGDDGASGLRAIRQRGGLTLVQDEASSAVSAMPRAALAAAAAAAETPLARLADAMRGAVK